jgi:hypothetical protein
MLPAALHRNAWLSTLILSKEGTIITILGWLNNQITSPSLKSEAGHVGPSLIENPTRQRASRIVAGWHHRIVEGDMTRDKSSMLPTHLSISGWQPSELSRSKLSQPSRNKSCDSTNFLIYRTFWATLRTWVSEPIASSFNTWRVYDT